MADLMMTPSILDKVNDQSLSHPPGAKAGLHNRQAAILSQGHIDKSTTHSCIHTYSQCRLTNWPQRHCIANNQVH